MNKKCIIASTLVLVVAGIIGVLLQDTAHRTSLWVRYPYYREALKIERTEPNIDIMMIEQASYADRLIISICVNETARNWSQGNAEVYFRFMEDQLGKPIDVVVALDIQDCDWVTLVVLCEDGKVRFMDTYWPLNRHAQEWRN